LFNRFVSLIGFQKEARFDIVGHDASREIRATYERHSLVTD
jgi:hypothetical protein